jgi:hypothetical protein
MDLDQIVVATITRARDAPEERLVARTLAALGALDLPIVASDGGSSPAFLHEMSQLPGVTLVPAEHHGMIGQVRASVHRSRALERPWVLYLESDKELFVTEWLGEFLHRAAGHPQAEVIVAARSERAFATFPPFQRSVETAFNAVASEVIGVTADYLYGPFLMRQPVTAHVDAVPPDLGWGWRPFVFARAGCPVAIEGEYACPPGQRREDDGERLHRLSQLAQNVQGLARAAELQGK